jgi:hypothetical protein
MFRVDVQGSATDRLCDQKQKPTPIVDLSMFSGGDRQQKKIDRDDVEEYDHMEPAAEANPIEWWSTLPLTLRPKMNQLRRLADCYLHSPCSSVASEEEFSFAGWQISPRRNRLSPDTAESIMMVARNAHLIPAFAEIAAAAEEKKAKKKAVMVNRQSPVVAKENKAPKIEKEKESASSSDEEDERPLSDLQAEKRRASMDSKHADKDVEELPPDWQPRKKTKLIDAEKSKV